MAVYSLHVTCRLTACTLGSVPGPTLSNEYGKTLPFTFFSSSTTDLQMPGVLLPHFLWCLTIERSCGKLTFAFCHVNITVRTLKMFSWLCRTVCSWFVAVIAPWMSLLSRLLLLRLCKDLMKPVPASCLLRMSVILLVIGRDVPKNLWVTQSWKLCMSVENSGGRHCLSYKAQGISLKPRNGLLQP